MSDSSTASGGEGGEAASRRPVERVRAGIAGVLGRLTPRSWRSDGTLDPRSGSPMSDAELREAFRAASLTVTPAPLGRLARREAAPAGPVDSASLPSPHETSPGKLAAVAPEVRAIAPSGPATAAARLRRDHAATAAPDPASPPETPTPDSSVIPANVTSTADDFFGGVVRRVDTQR
jgi:hypothetical protein